MRSCCMWRMTGPASIWRRSAGARRDWAWWPALRGNSAELSTLSGRRALGASCDSSNREVATSNPIRGSQTTMLNLLSNSPSPRGQSGPVFLPDERPAERKTDEVHRILIVEDDYLVAMEAEVAVVEAGFEAAGIANSAEEAVKLAKSECPTLVVMDIRLIGKRDGVDAALEIFRETGVPLYFRHRTSYGGDACSGGAHGSARLASQAVLDGRPDRDDKVCSSGIERPGLNSINLAHNGAAELQPRPACSR